MQIVLSIGAKYCGIFVRGGWGEHKHSARELLTPHLPALTEKLGLAEGHYSKLEEGHVFGEFRPLSCLDEQQWPQIADWLQERHQAYTQAIREVLEGAEQVRNPTD